jgi:hypothetical protein
VGNKLAQSFKDEQLKRITKMVDKEEDHNGKLPHGCIRRYYQQEKLTLDWLSIHQLYGLRRRRTEMEGMEKKETELRELEAEEASKDADMSDTKTVVVPYLTAIGRKKGSTDKSKEEFARPKEKLSEDIAVWWNTIKRDENHSTQLFEVVATQKTLAGLEHVVVKEPMIISRVSRGNFSHFAAC